MKTLLLTTATVVCAFALNTPAETMRDQLKKERAKIAYETYVDNNWEIFVMNADGSAQVNLTRNSAADSAPAWSN